MKQDPKADALTDIQSSIVDLIPNLDALPDAESCHRLRADIKSAIPVLLTLASYCESKGHAMQFRVEGNIPKAMEYEGYCDVIYKRLPEWAQVW